MRVPVYFVLLNVFALIGTTHAEEIADSAQFGQVVVTDAVDFREIETTSKFQISKFSVSIRNRDRKEWTGMEVIFRFPSGREFVAQGVSKIAPGRQSSFFMSEVQLEEARGELIGRESDFEIPQIIVSHLVSRSRQY